MAAADIPPEAGKLVDGEWEDGPGYHRHKCVECKCVWSHERKRIGECQREAAHKCPSCGSEHEDNFFIYPRLDKDGNAPPTHCNHHLAGFSCVTKGDCNGQPQAC